MSTIFCCIWLREVKLNRLFAHVTQALLFGLFVVEFCEDIEQEICVTRYRDNYKSEQKMFSK